MKIDQLTLKEGDLLICRNGYAYTSLGSKGGTLIAGEIYTVKKPKNDFGFIELKEQETKDCMGWASSRFDLIPAPVVRFKVGDRVEITGKFRERPWVGGMETHIGSIGTVTAVNVQHARQHPNYVSVNVETDDPETSGYIYHQNDLEPYVESKRKDIVPFGPVQTLGNAKKVTIVSTRGLGEFCFLGYIEGDAEIRAWNVKGDTPPGTHYRKIENVPPAPPKPTHIYLNVYRQGDRLEEGGSYSTRAKADASALKSRVGCVKVELKEVFND